MDELTTKSTSRMSADVSDMVLRETSISRLVFRPKLAENPNELPAAVEGTLRWQRKGPNECWEDVPPQRLTTLHKGEGYQISMNCHETLEFFKALGGLYRLQSTEGISPGTTVYVRRESALAQLSDLPHDELRALLLADTAAGSELVCTLLESVAAAHDSRAFVGLLTRLGPEELVNLNTAVNVRALEEAIEFWHKRKDESNEEFWQKALGERAFLMSLLFAWPYMILKEKAYVGGKRISNEGGGLVDFIMENQCTSNVALVEIKTPGTLLTAKEYRGDHPNISRELTGAIVQVLSYRSSLLGEWPRLRNDKNWRPLEPPCVVLAGNTSEFDGHDEKRDSFELFRCQLGSVTVITFDELFRRAQNLVNLLQGSTPTPEFDYDDDDIPF